MSKETKPLGRIDSANNSKYSEKLAEVAGQCGAYLVTKHLSELLSMGKFLNSIKKDDELEPVGDNNQEFSNEET